jgi:hypothetical protein
MRFSLSDCLKADGPQSMNVHVFDTLEHDDSFQSVCSLCCLHLFVCVELYRRLPKAKHSSVVSLLACVYVKYMCVCVPTDIDCNCIVRVQQGVDI